jgi:hypothetical protein
VLLDREDTIVDTELKMAAAAQHADATELEASPPRRERTLLVCPTCKRGLTLLASGTVLAPEVRVSATCVRCERLDDRYHATTQEPGGPEGKP